MSDGLLFVTAGVRKHDMTQRQPNGVRLPMWQGPGVIKALVLHL